MSIAYFDCFNGAGGDMIVASLVDAGADMQRLRAALESLPLDGYSLSIQRVTKQGFAATRFDVNLDERVKQPARGLQEILRILEASALSSPARANAARIFRRLAEAEAKVHGSSIERIHFHEVGAVDAILDVVGAVLALELLGIDRVVCSPLPVGSGTVVCEHGVLPVPAPATAELLAGFPLAPSKERGELTTPTAAAVLTTLASRFSGVPAMTIDSVGYGAGSRDGPKVPNLLRVLVGQTARDGDTDEVTVLETNLDDASPQVVAHCMERLFDAGALDVYTVPIQMKKSRPGVLLAVLCDPGDVPVMERILFAETSTLGVRRSSMIRSKMRRRHETVDTPFGAIRMKIGERHGAVTATPEFEDCKMAALKHGAALREVINAADAAWTTRIHGAGREPRGEE